MHDAGRLSGRVEHLAPPISIRRVAPEPTIPAREDQRRVVGPAGRQPVLVQLLHERSRERHRTGSTRFRVLLVPERNRPLDQRDAAAEIAPSEPERFPRPRSRVGEHRNEQGVTLAPLGEQVRPDCLYGRRGVRPDVAASASGSAFEPCGLGWWRSAATRPPARGSPTGSPASSGSTRRRSHPGARRQSG